ncbi:probable serine/threonine-protein kinase DDB_G0281745 [Leptopilina heterotoma]|uniref:probable serine/threonine-protein kinase DDB_G0281745 n=1 Tax=Leptopilina heterotoma TaxID=63436 RepID=UPI001CA8A3DE|nr:probable serine/threonine-protein kinase DDB_G0281745 [Leptopilina heterotoma]
MDQNNYRQIILKFGDESQNIFVENNKLNKSTLEEYFPKGSTLKYILNGESFLPNADASFIHLNPAADEYLVSLPRGNAELPEVGTKRRQRYFDMLGELYKGKDEPEGKKFFGQKISNKNQDKDLIKNKKSTSQEFNKSKKPLNRIVHVSWKHRKSCTDQYHYVGRPLGEKKKIVLNFNEDYPIDKLQSTILKQYIDEHNADIIEKSTVFIGTHDGNPITTYLNEKNELCDFWTFSKLKLKNTNHSLSLCVLTTKNSILESKIISETATNIEKVSVELNEKNFNRFREDVPTFHASFDSSHCKNSVDFEVSSLSKPWEESSVSKVPPFSRPSEQSFVPKVPTFSKSLKQSSVINISSSSQSMKKSSVSKVSPFLEAWEKSFVPKVTSFSNLLEESSVNSISSSSQSINKSSASKVAPFSRPSEQSFVPEVPTFSKSLKQSSVINKSSSSQFMENSPISKVPLSSKPFELSFVPKVPRLSKSLEQSSVINISSSSQSMENSSISKPPSSSKLFEQSSVSSSSQSLKKSYVNTNENDSIKSPSFSNITIKAPIDSNMPKMERNEHSAHVFKTPTCTKVEKAKLLKVSIPFIKENQLQFSDIILGRGGQGIVRRGKYIHCDVAIKSITKGRNISLALREIQLLDIIRHPNIIMIMAVSETPSQFHIVMELFDSSSLYDILFPKERDNKMLLEFSSKMHILRQLCSAICYLHSQSPPIIHRDIKPSNILINNHYSVKLCDMGLGKSKIITNLESSSVGTIRGTYLYMAPEIFLDHKEATVESDIWAFGCTIVELFSEESVWNIQGRNLMLSLAQNFQQKLTPNLESLPYFFQHIVEKYFTYDPQMRPNVVTLLECLSVQKM